MLWLCCCKNCLEQNRVIHFLHQVSTLIGEVVFLKWIPAVIHITVVTVAKSSIMVVRFLTSDHLVLGQECFAFVFHESRCLMKRWVVFRFFCLTWIILMMRKFRHLTSTRGTRHFRISCVSWSTWKYLTNSQIRLAWSRELLLCSRRSLLNQTPELCFSSSQTETVTLHSVLFEWELHQKFTKRRNRRRSAKHQD